MKKIILWLLLWSLQMFGMFDEMNDGNLDINSLLDQSGNFEEVPGINSGTLSKVDDAASTADQNVRCVLPGCHWKAGTTNSEIIVVLQNHLWQDHYPLMQQQEVPQQAKAVQELQELVGSPKKRKPEPMTDQAAGAIGQLLQYSNLGYHEKISLLRLVQSKSTDSITKSSGIS